MRVTIEARFPTPAIAFFRQQHPSQDVRTPMVIRMGLCTTCATIGHSATETTPLDRCSPASCAWHSFEAVKAVRSGEGFEETLRLLAAASCPDPAPYTRQRAQL
jgi:hypothetical protein